MDIQRFRMLYGDFDKKSKEIANIKLKKSGLTPDQGKLFKYIMTHHDVKQKEMCDYYHITKGTLSIQLKKLQQLGYIKKEVDEKDKRNYKLIITEQGRKMNQSIFEILSTLDQDVFSAVTEDEIETASEVFEKLNIQLDNMLQKEKGGF